jgi:hypothetical protein
MTASASWRGATLPVCGSSLKRRFFAWIILAVLAYREGWREVLFVLTTIEPSGDF